MKPLGWLVLFVVALSARAAEAQVTATPAATLVIAGHPEMPVNTTGAEYNQRLEVTFTLEGAVCQTGGDVPVAMEARGGNLTKAELRFVPADLRFHVDADEYLTHEERETAVVNLYIAPQSIPNSGLTVPVTVTATFASAQVAGCTITGTLDDAQDSKTFTVEFKHGGPLPTTPTPQMPGPSALGAALVSGLAAAALRRR